RKSPSTLLEEPAEMRREPSIRAQRTLQLGIGESLPLDLQAPRGMHPLGHDRAGFRPVRGTTQLRLVHRDPQIQAIAQRTGEARGVPPRRAVLAPARVSVRPAPATRA